MEEKIYNNNNDIPYLLLLMSYVMHPVKLDSMPFMSRCSVYANVIFL